MFDLKFDCFFDHLEILIGLFKLESVLLDMFKLKILIKLDKDLDYIISWPCGLIAFIIEFDHT